MQFNMFHLRRVQFQTFVKEKGTRPLAEPINDGMEPATDAAVLSRSTMVLLDKQTKIGRNPELVDVVLHSVVHSNMISRDHSVIMGEQDEKGKFTHYVISDRSLNGTYVNDTRVKDLQQLREGDLIKFGHVNGAAIKPGEFAPQQQAEFIFRFERSLDNYDYFGYSPKGIRLQTEQRRAYMQINSDRVFPTEVYSSANLVPVPKQSLPAPPSAVVPPSSTESSIPVNNTSRTTGAPVNSSSGQQIGIAVASSLATSSSSSSAVNSTSITSSVGTGTLPQQSSLSTATHHHHPSSHLHPANQLAHLAAVAAATTAAAGTQQAQQALAAFQSANQQHQQQQQALNALNQLGLGAATDEQVAAMNAQLRSLMASHDAMSAMERLAAQQQWQKSILNLNSLQQQNPLIYGHAFPAAAAAAAALFTGMGGIDLNSAAAAANPTAAAQYAAAASLWPNIRATLQPAANTQPDWTQQQKAAALAQQLQLRLPHGNLYQPQHQQSQPAQQQMQNSTTNAAIQHRSTSSVTVASSLFGAPSAFSFPANQSQQSQQQALAANCIPSSTSSSASAAAAAAAGLLIAAHSGHQQQHPQHYPSTSSASSSSAAYSSCTSSQPPGIRPAPLSRGASSSSLTPNVPPSSTNNSNTDSLTAAAARLAAAQHFAKEALEADQAKAAAGWSSIGISCTSTPAAAGYQTNINNNTSTANNKVSPIVAAAAAAAARMPASAFQGAQTSITVSSAQAQLQRIPGIASALAAAVAQAQAQQQQHQINNVVWQAAGGTPPIVPTPSVTPANNASSTTMALPPQLGTPPTIQQPLAQRLLCSSANSTLSLSGGSKSSSSSSGVSSAASSGNSNSLQSPTAVGGSGGTFRDSLSSSGCTSSLNTSGISSAFSTPVQQQNSTSLSSLTAAMFATEEVKKDSNQHQIKTVNSVGNTKKDKGRPITQKRDKITDFNNSVVVANSTAARSNGSLSADLDQLQIENKTASASITADKAKNKDEERQLMECDSSVPSPPSKPQPEDEEMLSRPGSSTQTREEENGQDKADPISRKRHSDTMADNNNGGSNGIRSNGDKPRPVKHARKSNEVARLLNDLTAGNCTSSIDMEEEKNIAENCIENGETRNGEEQKVIDFNWAENLIVENCADGNGFEGENPVLWKGEPQKLDENQGQDVIVSSSSVGVGVGRTYGWWRNDSWRDSLDEVEDAVDAESSSTMDSTDSSCTSSSATNKDSAKIVENPEIRRKMLSLEENWLDIFCFDEDGEKLMENGEDKAKNSTNNAKKTRRNEDYGSWQYMAERQQQKTTQIVKTKDKFKQMSNKGGNIKKPLRLDERKQLEIEKKKAHKMMRQISDSESSGDEHPSAKNMTNSEEEESFLTKNHANINTERQKLHRDRSSSNSSESIPTFRLSWSPNEKDSDDTDNEEVEQHKILKADSASDSEPSKPKKTTKATAASSSNLLNGGTSTTAGKRKPLSSAPTKKIEKGAMTNGEGKPILNGKGEEKVAKKRGPKPAEEKQQKKRGAPPGPRTRKNTTGSTNSTAATAQTREKGKPGRKPGRGRKPKPVDSEDEKNSSGAESDSGDDRRVLLNGRDKQPKMNGGDPPLKSKRGRKAGSKKTLEMAAEDTTVMEDWTGGTGDPEKCAHSKCTRPKDMAINWVQCDKCDKWFHSICALGKNSLPDDDQWYCIDCKPNGGAPATRRNNNVAQAV